MIRFFQFRFFRDYRVMFLYTFFRNLNLSFAIEYTLQTGYRLVNIDRPCTTPSNMSGFCVELRHCPTLSQMSIFPRTRYTDTYLGRSRCNRLVFKFGDDTLMCCEKGDLYSVFLDRAAAYLPKGGKCHVPLINYIWGGSSTHIYEFPWMVRIFYEKKWCKLIPNNQNSSINNKNKKNKSKLALANIFVVQDCESGEKVINIGFVQSTFYFIFCFSFESRHPFFSLFLLIYHVLFMFNVSLCVCFLFQPKMRRINQNHSVPVQ